MYNYRYINRHFQFGYTTCTLIIEDFENTNAPSFRIEKSFKLDPDLIDENFLATEARKDMLNIARDNAAQVEEIVPEEETIE